MSDLTVLHWDHEAVSAMVPSKGGDFAGGRFVFPEEGFDSDEAAGRWLKGELAGANVSGKRAAIVLPRADVVLRKLMLPPDIPENELPDLVRMQAATKSSIPLDQSRLDFVPLPVRAGQQPVLSATCGVQAVERIMARARAAGLEPVAMGVSSFATAARFCEGDEAALIVAVDGTQAEITLINDGLVQFSHSTDLTGESDEDDREWLTSDVNRVIVAADHLSAGNRLSRVVLVGRDELLRPLAGTFEERFECESTLIISPEGLGITSPEGLEVSDANGIGLGALAAMLGQAEPGAVPRIDFLNPRKRIERPDRTRLIRGLLVGGVAAAIFLAWLAGWWERRGIEQEIADLEQRQSEIETELSQGEPTLEKRNAIREWSNKEATWTRQLVRFDEALPGTDRMYLSELSLGPGGRETWGTITGIGHAQSAEDVSAFAASVESMGYPLEPPEAARDGSDEEYSEDFAFEITVPKPAES